MNYFIEAKRDAKGKLQFDKQKQPISINFHSTQLVEQMLDYRLRQLTYLSQQQIVRIHEGQLISQLVHGLGTSHVTNTAMTIHHVYGIPYLPASSVKGIVRHWFLQTFLKGNEKLVEEKIERSENEEKLYKVYEDVFGSQENRGKVNFFDVYIPSGTLIPDVMTVHFGNYYSSKGKSPASDDNRLKPIPFYVLKSDAPIEFAFSIQKLRKTNSCFSFEELAEIVSDWLKNALSEMGIGSKTASGYGRFSKWKDVTKEKIVNLKQELEREREERVKAEIEKAEAQKQTVLLNSMTEEEKLVYYISHLNANNEQDRQDSKGKYYDSVMKLKNIEAAKALKVYWKQTKDWVEKPKPKKKQEVKVMQLRKLLGEL
ncbi:type III-B CRISPR module RAMP protein Cmr6 [Pueribacillus theae]|uniref:type III-B CRISPR module RAMP protein Cmr6 n=1 Tax=Pueribacillus theae TaxID=2171751 RepID=UPI001401DE42|nr:type III-B CRISPR module RAMP protein Cmr6 [Pueribacillus theae]